MDASLKGLRTLLSQWGEDGKSIVIVYDSRSLHPSEKKHAITVLLN